MAATSSRLLKILFMAKAQKSQTTPSTSATIGSPPSPEQSQSRQYASARGLLVLRPVPHRGLMGVVFMVVMFLSVVICVLLCFARRTAQKNDREGC